MRELTEVRQAGEAFGPQSVEPSTALTKRVLRETRSGSKAGRFRRPAQRGFRRQLVWVAPLATAAAVATVAVTLSHPFDHGSPAPPTLTAQSVLLAAATHARHTPVPVPPPGSY